MFVVYFYEVLFSFVNVWVTFSFPVIMAMIFAAIDLNSTLNPAFGEELVCKRWYAVFSMFNKEQWCCWHCRWSILAWPHKLEQQVVATLEQYVDDEERFKKLQVLDQTAFADRIDSLIVRSSKVKIVLFAIDRTMSLYLFMSEVFAWKSVDCILACCFTIVDAVNLFELLTIRLLWSMDPTQL